MRCHTVEKSEDTQKFRIRTTIEEGVFLETTEMLPTLARDQFLRVYGETRDARNKNLRVVSTPQQTK